MLEGRRVLVVGASSGIGRATAVAAIRAGAAVALAARHVLRLDEAIAEATAGPVPAGARGVAVGCDLRDAARIPHAVAEASEALGGIDAVLCTAAVNRLVELADTDADTWHDILDTNLVGTALVVRAALPVLRSSAAPGRTPRVGVCTSDVVQHPMAALGAYAASKAALETTLAVWRQEVEDVALTRILIGPTMTDMAAHWDPDLSARMFERWAAEGHFDGVTPVTPEVVARELVAWVTAEPAPAEVDLYSTLGRGGGGV